MLEDGCLKIATACFASQSSRRSEGMAVGMEPQIHCLQKSKNNSLVIGNESKFWKKKLGPIKLVQYMSKLYMVGWPTQLRLVFVLRHSSEQFKKAIQVRQVLPCFLIDFPSSNCHLPIAIKDELAKRWIYCHCESNWPNPIHCISAHLHKNMKRKKKNSEEELRWGPLHLPLLLKPVPEKIYVHSTNILDDKGELHSDSPVQFLDFQCWLAY